MIGRGGSSAGAGSALSRLAPASAMTLGMAALWAVTHHFAPLARDGELYAVQALSRQLPQLRGDLFLSFTSQDRYTVFSPIFARVIDVLGLQDAELVLYVLCTTIFLAAAWRLVRELDEADAAWLSVALLIMAPGYYGSYQVFSILEDYFTARSVAEALVVGALACHMAGSRRLALAVAVAALFVHPLMALPGALLLACLWVRSRTALAYAAGGTLLVVLIAQAAVHAPQGGLLTLMDPAWLEVVEQRSQFLFLQFWTAQDWEQNARPFLGLLASMSILTDARARRLATAAMLVGAVGLAIAGVAGTTGPVALLVQGQAWRWLWITSFTSLVLLIPTAAQALRASALGQPCALLLLVGGTGTGAAALSCTAAGVLLWIIRPKIGARAARWLAAAAGIALLCLAAAVAEHGWMELRGPSPATDGEPGVIRLIRAIMDSGAASALLVAALGYTLRRKPSWRRAALAGLPLLGFSVAVLPYSLKPSSAAGTAREYAEFSAWRAVIPPPSSVLVLPLRNSASFVWFTLERPSYLSLDQSAGVVFSRDTALEVKRRSEVLLPVAMPDWTILSRLTASRVGKTAANAPQPALTVAGLRQICADPVLDFVVARDSLPLDPLTHREPGPWRGWNLYDCRKLRPKAPEWR